MLAISGQSSCVETPAAFMKTPKSEIGLWLAKARVARGFSQEEAAERADITQEYVSAIERGVRSPSRKVVRSLARVLAPEGASEESKQRLLDEGLAAAGFATTSASDSRAVFLRTSNPKLNNALAEIISALDRDTDDLGLVGPDADISALRSTRLFSLPASAGHATLIAPEDRSEHERLGREIEDGVRAIRVKGDCMEPFYRDGDILFVREQSTAENGQRVIARVDDEHLNCKVYRSNGKAYLEPTNGEGRIEAGRFAIRGVVVGFYRKER